MDQKSGRELLELEREMIFPLGVFFRFRRMAKKKQFVEEDDSSCPPLPLRVVTFSRSNRVNLENRIHSTASWGENIKMRKCV